MRSDAASLGSTTEGIDGGWGVVPVVVGIDRGQPTSSFFFVRGASLRFFRFFLFFRARGIATVFLCLFSCGKGETKKTIRGGRRTKKPS